MARRRLSALVSVMATLIAASQRSSHAAERIALEGGRCFASLANKSLPAECSWASDVVRTMVSEIQRPRAVRLWQAVPDG